VGSSGLLVSTDHVRSFLTCCVLLPLPLLLLLLLLLQGVACAHCLPGHEPAEGTPADGSAGARLDTSGPSGLLDCVCAALFGSEGNCCSCPGCRKSMAHVF
jgi:hypothetical protein